MAYHHFLEREHPNDYRHEEVQALVRAIRARENRLILGLSGMGVSNLLRFLVTREGLFKQQITYAYLSCDAFGDCLDHEIFFEEITQQLAEQGLGDGVRLGEKGYKRLRRLLTQVEGDSVNRIAIVVDQADKMLAAADQDFYRKLKALTDLNKRVCYFFAASPLLAETIDPENLLFAGRRLMLSRLNEQGCASAIAEEAHRLAVEFEPAAQAQLAYLTGGHPGLLRAVSSAVVAERLDLADLETNLVARLLARSDVIYRCQKIWRELDPTRQAALHWLAAGRPDVVAAATLTWLQDFGLIETRAGASHFFSPIFHRFVINLLSDGRAPTTLEPVRIVGASTILKEGREIIVAGKVFKGNQPVHVSRLELRLIACLKRERKIYSKDDIANYVYYEDKGEVSDAAIENLVRQVRKRLGEQYIKAYWGHGYEFMG